MFAATRCEELLSRLAARALPCHPAMGDLLLDAIGSPRHALLVATLLGIATQYLFGLLATFVVFFVLTAAERWPNLAPFALLLGALAALVAEPSCIMWGCFCHAAHPHVWDPTLRSYRFDHPGAKLRM